MEMLSSLRTLYVENPPGGDPIKVGPNVATFAWNASQMSDLANMAPTNGTDFALTLYWL